MSFGFLVVDKPDGLTSHDVVAAVRAVTGIRKVGHTGTLDPFATGVLPLALGPATRLIQFLDESIKVYDALLSFGASTDTGDPTGRVVHKAPKPTASEEEVAQVLQDFIGERLQRPHAFSAVKVKGKPLYHYARKGQEVEVAPRPITIRDMQLLHYDHDTLRVMITCSRGTYARVLANEIADVLGSAAHLSALQRPRSGPFYLEDAIDLPTLAELVAAEPGNDWKSVLLSRGPKAERVKWRPRSEVHESLRPWIRRPLDALSNLPLADVQEQTAVRVRNGGAPPPPPAGLGVGSRYLVVSGDDVIAVAEVSTRGPKTLRILPRV